MTGAIGAFMSALMALFYFAAPVGPPPEPVAMVQTPKSTPRPKDVPELSPQVFPMQAVAIEVGWAAQFRLSKLGEYRPLRGVKLFRGRVASACGKPARARGGFYCRQDQTLYLDLTFLAALSTRAEQPGLESSYVLAHLIAHHVQGQIGITDGLDQRISQVGKPEAIKLRIEAELHADCLVGVHFHTSKLFEGQSGGVKPEALARVVAQVSRAGSDLLQDGAARPRHDWTFATVGLRRKWLMRGLESGEMRACETFGTLKR